MIYYIRDNENNVIGFIYNGETYYYKKNIQQDVIGIYDSTFNQIVTYTYDSWGDIISIVDTSTNNIGTINPYRYRSYYYDNETELYYLNTRYYNPKWKRFINADGIIAANDCITNSNLYFYANNNPISYSDSDGNFSFSSLLGEFVPALVDVITKVGAEAAASVTGGVILAAAVGTGYLVYSIVKSVTNEKVKSKSKEKNKDKNDSDFGVYVLKENNEIKYCGRTNNLKRREAEHRINPYKGKPKFEKLLGNLNYEQSRIEEQACIERYGTLTYTNFSNKRNGIGENSPLYPKFYRYYYLHEDIYNHQTYVGG